MKSRLLPPPVADDHDLGGEALTPVYDRRKTDEIDEPTSADTPAARTAVETTAPVLQGSPHVSARPNGRLFVAAILLVCVATVGFSLWNTFLRDAAYGVVTGRVTTVSPPWSGTLTAMYVRAGDVVRQGDVLAVVDDHELDASIDRLSDDLRTAQAQLDAQAALLLLAARERGNETKEIRANYFDLRGELLAERSRYDELSSKLVRRRQLADKRAYSAEEIDSLEFLKTGLAGKIENLEQAIAALETRLDALPAGDQDTAQLKPWLAKIENYQAEIRRLRDKQRRGTLRAPLGGTVVSVACHVGQRADPEQILLELLPDNSLEFVLYVRQDQLNEYQVGQSTEVVVAPAAGPIACRITRIGQRFEKPQSIVAARYRPDEKLLPVSLKPVTDSLAATTLRIGSTVRQPASLFGF